MAALAIIIVACGGNEKKNPSVTATEQVATAADQAIAINGGSTQASILAQIAFERWAENNGEPYRDVRFDVEANDGFFAHVRTTAWFRPGMDASWEERDALIECRKVGQQWQCDQRFNFSLSSGERSRRTNATATAETQAAATAAVQATGTAVVVHATATAIASLPLPERLVAATGSEFVFVPAGEFVMGSPDGEGGNEEHPQHTVSLDEYWIGKTEVTNAQYARCVEAGVCAEPKNNRWNDSTFAQHPVTNVSWHNAVAYASWLTEQSGVVVRLPTEAEWEKAACGTDGRTYPWGNTDPNDRLLNYNSNVSSTTPVGSYPAGASPYGALDMAGNIWEWTADWYDASYYQRSLARNPTGPESGEYRVLRGGSYGNLRYHVRCTYRIGYYPDGFSDYGFRLLSPDS